MEKHEDAYNHTEHILINRALTNVFLKKRLPPKVTKKKRKGISYQNHNKQQKPVSKEALSANE